MCILFTVSSLCRVQWGFIQRGGGDDRQRQPTHAGGGRTQANLKNGIMTKQAPTTGNPLLQTLPLSLYSSSSSVVNIAYCISHIHINSTPKHPIVSVIITTDRPCYECIKFVTFKNKPPIAIGDQLDQIESCVTSIPCADANDERAWSSDDG